MSLPSSAAPIVLLYGYDPLCGWCYGFAPVLKAVQKHYPGLPIEIVMGGLMVDDRVQPYSDMAAYIRNACGMLEQVTGRAPSPAFFSLIEGEDCPMASSAPAMRAVAAVRQIAPEKTLAFASLLQDLHFEQGKDLNQLSTIEAAATSLAIEGPLDLGGEEGYSTSILDHPDLQADVILARQLELRSFPCLYLMDTASKRYMVVPKDYDPDRFVAILAEALTRF
ncbi:MAG: DsbA family protein [Cohaesibacter sp.]|jgi:putative protein-disulfide isomerase|nr:DsbA family protein [Cohaesibacter sp.]